MKIRHTPIYLFLGLVCTVWMHAQSPYFKTHPLGEVYRNTKLELVFEAPNSLLWFGTSDGLFSYDGLSFVRFFKADSTSNHVQAMHQDREGKIWIGYEDGTIYNLENQTLIPWKFEGTMPKSPITGFLEDKEGRFWIATYGEGVYYSEGQTLVNISVQNGLLGTDVYAMEQDELGQIWLGVDNGMSICSIQNGELSVKKLTPSDGLPDDIVRAIKKDKKGNFWIGMYDKGVCYYNPKSQKFEYPLTDWKGGIVNHLELFDDYELWIGTEGNGIWILNLWDYSYRRLGEEELMSNAKIYDLHKDIEGNIWVLSNLNGICHGNRQFEFLKTDFENVQAIVADNENTIWVGSQEGLFTHHLDSLGKSIFKKHLVEYDLNVVSLFVDKYQNLWIGTFGDGIYIFNKETRKIRHLTEKDGLTNGSILSIDGINGHVWLATLGGVTEIELKQDIFDYYQIKHRDFNKANGLGTNFIYKVFIDSQERTWFATDGKGISVLENGEITSFQTIIHTHEDGQKDTTELKTIYSITEDRQGHIWFSTVKDGIFEYDGENFTHLTVKEGIRDLEITSLVTDKKGNILIVHPTGIDVLTPETHHLIYYDSEVGIESIEPNLNAVCTDRRGDIWIGCHKSLVKYIPLNEELEIHLRTQLNSVSVFLEPIDFYSNQTFEHHQNNLVFDYLGLWYTDPETVKYRYQLEGYNPDWIESNDRKVTYSNLSKGKYTFNVTSTENDAWLDEPVISYSFEILPPFWQRWWFILLSFLAVSGLFYWYQKERDIRIQRVNLLEREKAESELAALKAQINPHFLFNSFNTLVMAIEEDPPVAVEYVEKMSDFYRTMLQYRDVPVISIEEEIEVVKNYEYLLKRRFGDNFKVNINLNKEPIFLAPLTLQVLLENAVKHNIISKSKPLIVNIEMRGKDYLVVENNLQKKVNPERSTRFGLQSLIKRYDLLTGKKVKVEEGEHTFRVAIPVVTKKTPDYESINH